MFRASPPFLSGTRKSSPSDEEMSGNGRVDGSKVSYLLRVQLPDRPGSLGSLAVALGSVGADIVSFDVVHRSDGIVVDDLVVDIAPGKLPDTLITAAERLTDVHVDSIRPFSGLLDGHRELELVDRVAGATNDRVQVLVEGVPKAMRVAWCLVISLDDGGGYRVAGSDSAPSTRRIDAPWLPLHGPSTLDVEDPWVPELWRDLDTKLAAAPLGSPTRALLVGRPGGPEFRPSEVARLGFLAGVVATVLF